MASLDKFLKINYKLTHSENFDEAMKEMGVGLIMRKMGNTVSPTIVMSKDGDTYTINTMSALKDHSVSFKLNEEFDEETLDGRAVKGKVTVDGNVMTHIQTDKDGNVITIVREFDENQVVVTLTVNNIVCKRTYTKQ